MEIFSRRKRGSAAQKAKKKEDGQYHPKIDKRAKGVQQKCGQHQGNSREQHRQDKAVFQND